MILQMDYGSSMPSLGTSGNTAQTLGQISQEANE